MFSRVCGDIQHGVKAFSSERFAQRKPVGGKMRHTFHLRTAAAIEHRDVMSLPDKIFGGKSAHKGRTARDQQFHSAPSLKNARISATASSCAVSLRISWRLSG